MRGIMIKVPRIIHQIWVGSTMPLWALNNHKWWAELHPKWTLMLWNDHSMVQDLENQKIYNNAPKYAKGNGVWQLRADIARYEILYRYGGFYADMDTVPLRPIDDALDGLDEFAAMEDRTWIGNTYLASVSRHPVMRRLIDDIPKSVELGSKKGFRPNKLTGPQYLTPIWRELDCYVTPESRLWFPYSYVHVRRRQIPSVPDDAYAIHEWKNTQISRSSR